MSRNAISANPVKTIFSKFSGTGLISEGRFPAGERFHFLLSSWTLLLLAENSLLVIQKAKFLHIHAR